MLLDVAPQLACRGPDPRTTTGERRGASTSTELSQLADRASRVDDRWAGRVRKQIKQAVGRDLVLGHGSARIVVLRSLWLAAYS